MANAKTELLVELKNKAQLKCAKLRTGEIWEKKGITEYQLQIEYSKEDLEAFLDSIDFDYDDSYGSQKLFGIVWLQDGTWLSRGEYDGSEWWRHNILPEIPTDLIK